LARWHKIGLALFAGLALAFGVLVEIRSAYMERAKGDLLVYLRAAWAVRTGISPYTITDHNGWHYNYPPLLAIVLTPLADPIPAVLDRSGYLPYRVSVAVWYLINLCCLAWGVHTLARAVQETSAVAAFRDQPAGCRAWWGVRVLPVLACVAPVGHTLMRGQVNLILLALVCGLGAAALRGRGFRAGLYLAGAICLKIIPAFLLIFPLWRRDRRCLAGCAAGLVVGLVLVPLSVFGPQRTASYYGELAQGVLLPGLASGADQSRAKELIDENSSHSQSLGSTLHNLLHPDPATRPGQASRPVRLAHWGIGAVLTALTLAAAGWRRGTPMEAALLLGALTLVMLLVSPVSHLHYFCLAVPAVLAVVATTYERGAIGWGTWLLLAAYALPTVVPLLPRWERLRDVGPLTFATLALWAMTVAVLVTQRRQRQSRRQPVAAIPQAA
jgi:hypothetical protein